MKEKIREAFKGIRMRYLATALVVVIAVGAAVLISQRIRNRTFESYEVETSEERADSVSRFAYVDGSALRYSGDGASLMKKDLSSVWNASFEMSDPRVDICGSEILFYDRGGTAVYIYNTKEKVASFNLEKPILLARISEKGTVAVLLRDGEKTQFVYYTKEGTEIASGESTMTDPGYPFAMAISDDGMKAAISYLTVTGGTTGTAVRFYHFRSGKQGSDNLAGELLLDGSFAPDLQYLGGRCVVFRDNGFTVVSSPSSMSDSREVDFNRDIVSTFCDDSHIGFIFRSDDRNHLFEMSIYTTAGNLISETYIDHSFSRVHVCGDEVIVSGETDLSVFSMKGVRRFEGTLREGNVADVLKAGRQRYLVLTDQTMEVIRLR